MPKNAKTKVTYNTEVVKFTRFGSEIKVTPKANATVSKRFNYSCEGDCIHLNIGIGKSEVAHLVMTKKAWEALNAGAKVSIQTTKEFANQ